MEVIEQAKDAEDYKDHYKDRQMYKRFKIA